jgi:hypothetical protein
MRNKEIARLRAVIESKHGGEPLALLEELDEARRRCAEMYGQMAVLQEEVTWLRERWEELRRLVKAFNTPLTDDDVAPSLNMSADILHYMESKDR